LRQRTSSLCLLLLLSAATVSHAETYFEAAQRLLESGQETEARRALNREIAVRPRNLEARYDLAVLLERIGHPEKAAELYRDNIKRGRHLPSIVNLAAYLRKQGRRDEATALLLKATKKFRAEAVPWYILADMAEKQGNQKKAAEYYQKAIKADAKNGFAQLRYGRFLAKQNKLKQAEPHIILALSLLPQCAPCQRMGGDILARAGKQKSALKAWQRSAALEPDAKLSKKIFNALQTANR